MKRFYLYSIGYGSCTVIADTLQIEDGCFKFLVKDTKNMATTYETIAIYPVCRTVIHSIEIIKSTEIQ